jgi:hypothetical protein
MSFILFVLREVFWDHTLERQEVHRITGSKTSVGKPENVRLSGRSRFRWNNVKIDVKGAGNDGNDVGWTHLTQT